MGLWRPCFTNCSSMCLFGFSGDFFQTEIYQQQQQQQQCVCEMNCGSVRPWTCGSLKENYTKPLLSRLFIMMMFMAFIDPSVCNIWQHDDSKLCSAVSSTVWTVSQWTLSDSCSVMVPGEQASIAACSWLVRICALISSCSSWWCCLSLIC